MAAVPERFSRLADPALFICITLANTVLAPSATPRDVVAKLNTALVKILGTPAIKERFATLGAEVQPSTSEQLGVFIREDLAQWVKVVKQAGI